MKFVDDFVAYCQEFTGCPEIFLKWSGLLALSAVAGDTHVLRRGDWDVRPNLWVLLIGNSSSYKSAGLNAARRLLQEATPLVLAAQEYSHEAMIEEIHDYPHRVFYYDEAHSFFSMLDSPYNKGKMKSAFMSLYGRVPLKRKIKGKDGQGIESDIKTAYICWGGASTPVQLTEVLQGRTTDLLSGLMPRFIMVPYFGTEKSIADPPPADPDKRDRLIERLKTLSLISEKIYVYTPDALKAKSKWLANFNKNAASADLLLSAFYRKLRDEHFHKIAMLSAFDRESITIDVPDIAEAIDYLWPVEREWPNLLERLTEKEWDREAKRVAEFLKSNKGTWVSRSQILRAVRGIKAQKLSAILDGFLQDNQIIIRKGSDSDRPSTEIMWVGATS